MNRFLKNAPILLFFILINSNTWAKSSKIKFGKVSKEELEMKVYDADSSAVAVILYDNGRSYFEYENNESNSGFMCKFERHVRIKILKPEGFDFATFKIPIYHHAKGKEEVEAIKARTYNLEDKLVVSKLSKKLIYKEKTSPNWETVKFTMPNIKVGTIIECKYKIKSPFYQNLRSWQFQYNIPVVFSKYSTRIPEYFNYQKKMKGYYPITCDDQGLRTETFHIKYTEANTRAGGGPHTIKHEFTLTPLSNLMEYSAENIPAFNSESHMLAEENYLSELEFELQWYQIEDGRIHNYSSNWKSVQQQLLNFENFGQALKKDGFTEDILSEIITDSQTDQEKLNSIFCTVKNNIRWTKENRLFCKKSLRKTWKEKTGNSAEINLLLTAMLKKADINANPVILSTRANGIIHPSHPSLTQMNYVVACATIDGNKYLMDATDPFHPVGILPFRCLNGQGRIITDNNTEWINLEPTKGSKINMIANLKLSKEGVLSGNVREMFYDYTGIKKRKAITNNTDNYSEKLQADHEDWNITEVEYKNVADLYKPISISYSVNIENYVDMGDDKTYINPIMKYQTRTNPFNLEKREYPINFGHPIFVKYSIILELPKDYTVEGKPKNTILKLPDNGGSYYYQVNNMGNKVMITSKFNIGKSQFQSSEYDFLKNFYNQIITKENQVLVLKKVDPTAIK